MKTAENQSGGLTKDVVVYVCILAIAGLQIVIAYQNLDGRQMFLRMLSLALVQAGLGAMFFMHLWAEKRTLLVTLALAAFFVLATMQYGWPDSFRILVGVPFAQSH